MGASSLSPSMLQAIPQVLDAMQDEGISLAYRLIPDGQSLLHTLLFLMLVITGLKALMEEGDMGGVIAELLRLILMWGLCSWLISLRFYPVFIKDLSDTFNQIVVHLGSGESGVYAGISAFLQVANAIYNNFYPPGHPFDLALLEHLGNVPGWLATLFLDGLCLMGVLFSAVIYVVLYAMSQLLFTIGAVLGPLFIPWLLFPVMSFMFDGWLRFMIVAGFYKVVGYVVIALMAPLFEVMTNWVHTASAGKGLGGLSSTGNSMSVAFVLLLISGLIGYFMFSIPGIAQGLVSGSAISHFNFAKKPLSALLALSGMAGGAGGESSSAAASDSLEGVGARPAVEEFSSYGGA